MGNGKLLSGLMRVGGVFVLTVAAITIANYAYSFPTDHWIVESGEKLEVLRDYVCFGEGRAGKRTTYKMVSFSNTVLSAEVMISGFNMWYTREGHDHEVMQERVDAWVRRVGGIGDPDQPGQPPPPGPNVWLEFEYIMQDEDTGDSDDFNDACIGFTVIARTK